MPAKRCLTQGVKSSFAALVDRAYSSMQLCGNMITDWRIKIAVLYCPVDLKGKDLTASA